MELAYYSDADWLSIELSEHPGVERREIAGGVVPDCDAQGSPVDIGVDDASHTVPLEPLVLTGVKGEVERRAG